METRVVSGNPEYRISKDLEISRIDGGVCDLYIDGDIVHIELFGHKRALSNKLLMIISWYELSSLEMIDNVEYGPIANQLTRNGLGYWIRFVEPIYVMDGYRVIPEHCRYAISKEGDLRKIDGWKSISSGVYNKYIPYPTCSVYNPLTKKNRRATRLHRLVAQAWVFNDNPFVKNIVDHLDNDPTNYHHSNLKWTTNSENIIRGLKQGTSQTVEVRIRDVMTGKVFTVYSIGEAIRRMGDKSRIDAVNPSIRRRGLISGRYEVRLEDDDTPWIWKRSDIPGINSRYTVNVTTSDGVYHVLHGIKEVYKFTNRYFKQPIPTSVPEMVDLLGISEYINDIEMIDRDPDTSCQARCEKTGIVTTSENFSALGREIGVSKSVVKRYSRLGHKYIYNGYRFRLESTEDWPKEIIYVPKRQNRIILTNISNGDIEVHSSKRKMCKDKGWSRSGFDYSLKEGKSFNGYKILEEIVWI